MRGGTLAPSFAFPGSFHTFSTLRHIGDVMTHAEVNVVIVIASQDAV